MNIPTYIKDDDERLTEKEREPHYQVTVTRALPVTVKVHERQLDAHAKEHPARTREGRDFERGRDDVLMQQRRDEEDAGRR